MVKNVVTVGGGTGSPAINQALIATGKVKYIQAIAAVFDSGGATGRRRLNSEGKEPAFSDPMRILLSLANPATIGPRYEVIKKWFMHRDTRDAVLGHDIISRFFNKDSGYTQIEEDLRTIGINFMGTVIPSTTHSTNILFTTRSGRKFLGEHLLDGKTMSKDTVIDMVLNPQVTGYLPAIKAITSAEVIFLACGSPHGSVLCNFLPSGMRLAMRHSKAQVFVITNLVSTRNETHDFSPQDYINLVKKYTGSKVTGLIVPDISRQQFEKLYPKVARLYDLEQSYFLGWEKPQLRQLENSGIKVIAHQATKIINVPDEGTSIVRHDPLKLAEALKEI